MNAAVGIRPTGPLTRIVPPGFSARLRDGRGFGLVELLIALLVLNVGILAMVAAFNAGAVALRQASMTSNGSAVAEMQMETFRGMHWNDIPLGATTEETTGPDGRRYRVDTEVVLRSEDPGTAGAVGVEREVKVAKVRVVDVGTARTVITMESTFDESVGA